MFFYNANIRITQIHADGLRQRRGKVLGIKGSRVRGRMNRLHFVFDNYERNCSLSTTIDNDAYEQQRPVPPKRTPNHAGRQTVRRRAVSPCHRRTKDRATDGLSPDVGRRTERHRIEGLDTKQIRDSRGLLLFELDMEDRINLLL